MAVSKEQKNKSIDAQMRKMASDAEGERLLDKERRQRENKELRRAEKRTKRALNIEICSEIVDLIMDVCDEAALAGGLLEKPKWR
jgi:hypothetical protein